MVKPPLTARTPDGHHRRREYAQLTDTDIDALGAELDTIRREVEESLGARDAAYIRRAIAFQRAWKWGRGFSSLPAAPRAGWAAGTAALAFAKSVENMESAATWATASGTG